MEGVSKSENLAGNLCGPSTITIRKEESALRYGGESKMSRGLLSLSPYKICTENLNIVK